MFNDKHQYIVFAWQIVALLSKSMEQRILNPTLRVTGNQRDFSKRLLEYIA